MIERALMMNEPTSGFLQGVGTEDKLPTGLDRRDWIAGLERGLAVLEAFDAAHPRLTAAQMGERLGTTRTAARRYLLTLAHLGYVGTDGKLFWLAPRSLRLGQMYLETSRLGRIVQPYLQRVTAGTNESAYASVMDGDDVIYIARNGLNRHMNTGYVLGARVAAHVTAAGMLMLALRDEPPYAEWVKRADLRTYTSFTITDRPALRSAFDSIREQDWALSEQQLELDQRGVAVPLRDTKGNLFGALSVTMAMGHESSQAAVARVLGVLKETAQSLRPLL
jgi:IclR family pca regulon transcriptional regulator